MSSKKKKKKYDKEHEKSRRENGKHDSNETYEESYDHFFDFLSKEQQSSTEPGDNFSSSKQYDDDNVEDKVFVEWNSGEHSDETEASIDKSFEYRSKGDKQMEHHSCEYTSLGHDEEHSDYGYRGHKDSHSADVVQDTDQFAAFGQDSDEFIFVKDSCNIMVQTTDTQAAVSIQIALQLAIALVVRITLADSDQGQSVLEDLLQYFDSEQSNYQKICIENSKDVTVITTDTDVAANIQALLEVLLSLVAKIDVL
ncbi:spore coat protein [Calidifontibacillus oryziterrae]|uniref:spore coat protein n=1 Tax=Calidifontibacillus oryziterrae TaxID=1191699 RepID=UPI0002EB012A|nr:spore coat protein [Calidifontibacillus oryziterrae]